MALNGEEGRRRVNNERVERCAAASETSLEMYVRVGVTEWKVETRRRAHEVGGRGSEHEEGPRHRFRVLLLHMLPSLLSLSVLCVLNCMCERRTLPVYHAERRVG